MTDLTSEEAVKEIKAQWKSLWRDRLDDKVKAEGIANTDYSLLFVERGTVVCATRSFKPPDLRDILEHHRIADAHRLVAPNVAVGGWGKFIRTVLVNQKSPRRVRRAAQYFPAERQRQHLKKGGRGWLHY